MSVAISSYRKEDQKAVVLRRLKSRNVGLGKLAAQDAAIHHGLNRDGTPIKSKS